MKATLLVVALQADEQGKPCRWWWKGTVESLRRTAGASHGEVGIIRVQAEPFHLHLHLFGSGLAGVGVGSDRRTATHHIWC